MTDRIISATAVIRGRDDTGGAFQSVTGKIDALSKKFGQVGKAANISAAMERNAAALKRMQDQLAAIDKVKGAEEKLSRLSARYAEQRAAVDRARAANDAAGASNLALRSKMEQAERVAIRLSASFHRQEDVVAGLKRQLSDSGVAVSHLASEENRLKSAVDASSAALARQNQMLRHAAASEATLAHRREAAKHFAGHTGRHLVGGVIGASGGIGAAYVAARGIEHAAKVGAEFEGALNRVRNVANDEGEVDLARDISAKAAAANPYTTRTQAVEDYVELRSLAVSNKPGEAINREAIERNVMLLAKARAALASSGYTLEAGEAKSLAQAIEGTGRTLDPRAQEKMLDAYVRGKQVFGNALQASGIRDFVMNAKSSNFATADDAFFRTTIARIAQGNASRLGNETNQTIQTIIGGHMTKAGAEWLAKVGVIDHSQIRKGGGGKFYIAGKIKGQDVLSSEPTGADWTKQVLLPGIEHAGALNEKALHARMKMMRDRELKANPKAQIDEHTLEERALHGLIADFVSKSGFRTTVTDNLVHAIANAYQTAKDVEQMNKTKGMDASKTLGQNPEKAFEELQKSISSLVSTVTSPAARDAGGIMHSWAQDIGGYAESLAKWQKQHPVLAAALPTYGVGAAGGFAVGAGGYLAYQWITAGAALHTSAGALDAAAGALTRAAVAQGGKGVAPGAAAGAGAGAGTAARTGGPLVALGSTAMTGAAVVGVGGMMLPDPLLPEGAAEKRVELLDTFTRWLNRQITGAKPGEERTAFSIRSGPADRRLTLSPDLAPMASDYRERYLRLPTPAESRRAPIDEGRLPGDAAYAEIPNAASARASYFNLAREAARAAAPVDYSEGGYRTGLPAPSGGGFDLGSQIHAALADLKAHVEQPIPIDVTGKLEPVKLEGAVAITVRAAAGTEVTHTSSSGQVNVTRLGTSMPNLVPGGALSR